MPLTLPDNLADADLALLYLADELPPDARDRFAERLAAEASLRQQVDRLTADQAAVFGALDRADSATVLPSPFFAARQIGEAAPAAAQSAVPQSRRWRTIGRWALVPAAAAAVLALGLTAWYVSIPADDGETPVAQNDDDSPSLLALRPGAGSDVASMTDDQILAQFEPIVVEPPLDTERQAAALLYLDKALPSERGPTSNADTPGKALP